MRAYQVGWLIAAGALALVGMLAAAAMSPANLLILFPAFAVVGAVAVLLIRLGDGRPRRGRVARDTLIGAGAAGSAASAFAGLTMIMGAVAIPVVLVVPIASPWAVGAIRRWVRTVSGPSEGQLDAVVQALASSSPGLVPCQPLPQVQPATDEQLCHAWCHSFRALEATASRRKFMRIVEERRGYLDELERRNPAAFAAWLASGATPAGNPLPYLSLAQIDRTAINWDELIDGRDW